MCDNADLIEACKNGYYEKVIFLLERNYTVHVRDSKQATPLYHSCCHGYYEISSALIQSGSDVNARVQWGSTALHAAADRGHINCVRLLIQSGADLSIQNNRGDTALHLCAYRGYIEIVKLLIFHKSNLFIKNNNEKTPTDEAEGNNHPNTAELLRQNMIAIQQRSGNLSGQHFPVQLSNVLPANVHSPASMSIPPLVPQKEQDNFVRYSRDLSRFTRQSLSHTNTEHLINKYQQKRPSSHPIATLIGTDDSNVALTNLQNGLLNGYSSSGKNQSDNMLDNRTKTHDQGREAMENFAETLQLQLVKKMDESEEKDKKIKELTDQLHIQTEKLKNMTTACFQLKEENEKLKSDLSGQSVHESCNVQLTHSHLGILNALRLLQHRNQTCFGDEQSLQSLKEVLRSQILIQPSTTSLDIPNKEWRVGKDYILLGDKPLNYSPSGDRDGSCSLVFLISHNRKEYVLKMMTNLINLHAKQHGEGNSLDQFLIHNFGSEHQIPVTLPTHQNIVPILHYYMGATDRFKKFINLLIPSKFDVPIEMASRTSFLVMNKYPQTLKSFMLQQRLAHPEPNYGLKSEFLLQLLYQIFSALHHLQKNGVIHRDIKADNIFMDEYLRPVVADFGFAMKLTFTDGSPIQFQDSRHILAGNNHAWAPELTRFGRVGRTHDEQVPTTLQQIYRKADAYAVSRMFYSLLRPVSEEDEFPQSSVNRPHYEESEIPGLPDCYHKGIRHILHNLVLDDPLQRMSERKAMLCAGMMLFYPTIGEIQIESDVVSYCQARMFSLLTQGNTISCAHTKQQICMEQSVALLSPVLESDFMCNISPSEFWETYQYLKMRNLL